MRKTAIVRVGAAVFEKIDEDHWSDLDMEIHEHIQPRRSGMDHEVSARLDTMTSVLSKAIGRSILSMRIGRSVAIDS